MNRRHACGWPGCGTSVPISLWGCREHWFALPREIRTRINRAYQQGDREALLRAHRRAIQWIKTGTLPDEPKGREGLIQLPRGRAGKRHYFGG